MMTESPSNYNLSHPVWRPHQYETTRWLLGLRPGSFAALEAECGSGKTAYTAACGSRHKTIATVGLKSLQDQYVDYGFVKLTGRSNYPCVHPDRLFEDATAEDCVLGMDMWQCPHPCQYLAAKAAARAAQTAILNYHYWCLTGFRQNAKGKLNWEKAYLFLDEAHDLHKVAVGHYSVEVSSWQRAWYDLPSFPAIAGGMPSRVRLRLALPWCESSLTILEERLRKLEYNLKMSRSDTQRKKLAGQMRAADRVTRKLELINSSLQSLPDDWYVASDESGFMAKPLTARHVFRDLFRFDNARVVAMSATIGDFGAFGRELGIEGHQHTRRVESRFAPETRPVRVLDCPRMSARATEGDFERQADLIMGLVQECPPEWSGLIHVTRKREAYLLAQRLMKRGLDRVWPMPGNDGSYVPTSEQVLAWEQRKKRVPNSIATTWSCWQGYDGLDERINIVAKIPFEVFGSPGSYEEAWRKYSMERYYWVTANTLTQGLGRTRRGREEDYDLNGKANGLVAIVDGSFGRIKNKLVESVRASLVEG